MLLEPNFKCSDCKLKNLKKNCNKCTHSFYRLNFYINLKRKQKLELLNILEKKKVKCNEGPCPEIYKEKVFKNLNNFSPKKLANAIKLGDQSLVYHINPSSSEKKLKSDIKIINKTLLRYINV